MRFVVLSVIVLLSAVSLAQETRVSQPEHQVEKTPKLVCWCEIDAQFPGGITEFHKYIQQHLNLTGIDGFNQYSATKIYVAFTIDEYGEACDIEVANVQNSGLNKEIQRVFGNMPIWSPRELGCDFVKTRLCIPISINWLDPVAQR